MGPWMLNCQAPDEGNMHTLLHWATDEQKERWMKPLLAGEMRSAFLMTEPAVASSDATNIETSIRRDGGHYVINGRKWWSSGVGDPRCKVAILMGKTDPSAARHAQQSMILVPMDTMSAKRCWQKAMNISFSSVGQVVHFLRQQEVVILVVHRAL